MATRYDYSDIEFAKRIRLRREIMDLNKEINTLFYRNNLDANMHAFVMEQFYGGTTDKVLKRYEQRTSPIDFFNSKALELFRDYLQSTINYVHHFNVLEKATDPNYLRKVIALQAQRARKEGREKNSLPEYNDSEQKLPTNITGVMLKKAEKTLVAASPEYKEYTLKPNKQKRASFTNKKLLQEFKQYVDEKLSFAKNLPEEYERFLKLEISEKEELAKKQKQTKTQPEKTSAKKVDKPKNSDNHNLFTYQKEVIKQEENAKHNLLINLKHDLANLKIELEKKTEHLYMAEYYATYGKTQEIKNEAIEAMKTTQKEIAEIRKKAKAIRAQLKEIKEVKAQEKQM